MPRITIWVDETLRERVDKHGNRMNISYECQKALRSACDRLERDTTNADIETVKRTSADCSCDPHINQCQTCDDF